MTAQPPPLSPDQIAGALDWWRLAGVEVDTLDEATVWLDAETAAPEPDVTAAPQPSPAPPPKAPPPPRPSAAIEGLAKVPGEPDDWPAELAAFRPWWMEHEKFSPAGAFPRVPPRGPAQAQLMVVVGQPEEQDGETLLSGPQGALLGGFLRAAGIAQEAVYFASLLPRHTLAPDWGEVGAAGYGRLLAHHIAIAAPQRLIVFGRDILAHLPHEPAQEPAHLRVFNHGKLSIPLLPTRDLANLSRRAAYRARFWQQWLECTEG